MDSSTRYIIRESADISRSSASCNTMRLIKLVFAVGIVLVLVFLFSSKFLLYQPKRVHWISATDLAELFIPQRQEVVVKTVKSISPQVNLADVLYKKVRILCWIMTQPKSLEKKAKAVFDTWATRCNIFLFMSSAPNSTIPNVVALKVEEGRNHLTMKTMKGFQYAWDHYKNEADWFMKADDDTFVIVENLRYLLAHHDPKSPIYFGHHFKTNVKQGYMSGGGGYVLSKEALRRVVTDGIPKNLCEKDQGAEDVKMGQCLQNLGVKPELSIDTFKRESFHPFTPGGHYGGGYPGWYYQYTSYGKGKGRDCCSDYSITFHYVDPNLMYLLDFLIYKLKAFGVNDKFNTSLANSIFQHDKKKTPYIQTIAVLPTATPVEAAKHDLVSNKAQIEKVQKFLVDHDIKVVQQKGISDVNNKVADKVSNSSTDKQKTRR